MSQLLLLRLQGRAKLDQLFCVLTEMRVPYPIPRKQKLVREASEKNLVPALPTT